MFYKRLKASSILMKKKEKWHLLYINICIYQAKIKPLITPTFTLGYILSNHNVVFDGCLALIIIKNFFYTKNCDSHFMCFKKLFNLKIIILV